MSAGALAAWSLAVFAAVLCAMGVAFVVWLAVELVLDAVRARAARKAEREASA